MKIYEIHTWRDEHKGFGYGEFVDIFILDSNEDVADKNIVNRWAKEINLNRDNPYHTYGCRKITEEALRNHYDEVKKNYNCLRSAVRRLEKIKNGS